MVAVVVQFGLRLLDKAADHAYRYTIIPAIIVSQETARCLKFWSSRVTTSKTNPWSEVRLCGSSFHRWARCTLSSGVGQGKKSTK